MGYWPLLAQPGWHWSAAKGAQRRSGPRSQCRPRRRCRAVALRSRAAAPARYATAATFSSATAALCILPASKCQCRRGWRRLCGARRGGRGCRADAAYVGCSGRAAKSRSQTRSLWTDRGLCRDRVATTIDARWRPKCLRPGRRAWARMSTIKLAPRHCSALKAPPVEPSLACGPIRIMTQSTRTNRSDILAQRGRFALVEGQGGVRTKSGATLYVNFGRHWSRGFCGYGPQAERA